MAATRARALAAAIELVGASGVRSLTHARVDAAADLPKGSTSNHFRTKAALIAGVIDAIATQERAELAGGPEQPPGIRRDQRTPRTRRGGTRSRRWSTP